MAKCTAHLICEVHRKLTMSVALSFGFDNSFLWSTELQHNLVSIPPQLIERLRLRYVELTNSALSLPTEFLPTDVEGDGNANSANDRVAVFLARWADFAQRYCTKSNKGREECILQAFRHGRRPHDAEFDRLFDLFSWLLHEARLLFTADVTALDTDVGSLTLADDDEEEADDDGDKNNAETPHSPAHPALAQALSLVFGAESDVVQGFVDADFVFSSEAGRSLRWRSYLLAHLMRDITDAVLGLFGLRQSKSDDYPASQLQQIHDSILYRAGIDISPQRWAKLYRQCVVGTHLDMGEECLSSPASMDSVWVELVVILHALFGDPAKLVDAIIAFLSSPVSAAPADDFVNVGDAHGDDDDRAVTFPNHNQIHVLGNLLELPLMQHEQYCGALSSLLADDEYWLVIAPLCAVDAAQDPAPGGPASRRPHRGGGVRPAVAQHAGLTAAAFRYLARMVQRNGHRLARLELLKLRIRAWITGVTTGDTDQVDNDDSLVDELRDFGGMWGSLIIHDVIAGFHGFVTRTIRGHDTRALKQRITTVVGSVLGGTLARSHLRAIVRQPDLDVNIDNSNQDEVEAAALEEQLLALRVIDQFGVIKARCLPHDVLMFVRRVCASPAAEHRLQAAFAAARRDAVLVLERLMAPSGALLQRLVSAVLEAISAELPGQQLDHQQQHQHRQHQMEDVVRSAVEKMCLGTSVLAAERASVTRAVLPPLPPHTARRQTRKYVRTKRKLEQEEAGPVRVLLEAFFAEARRLVTAARRHFLSAANDGNVDSALLHDLLSSLAAVEAAALA